jgi:hypothetical protein
MIPAGRAWMVRPAFRYEHTKSLSDLFWEAYLYNYGILLEGREIPVVGTGHDAEPTTQARLDIYVMWSC